LFCHRTFSTVYPLRFSRIRTNWTGRRRAAAHCAKNAAEGNRSGQTLAAIVKGFFPALQPCAGDFCEQNPDAASGAAAELRAHLPRISVSANPAPWEKAFCRRDRAAVITSNRST
jgi:hypothetical protein